MRQPGILAWEGEDLIRVASTWSDHILKVFHLSSPETWILAVGHISAINNSIIILKQFLKTLLEYTHIHTHTHLHGYFPYAASIRITQDKKTRMGPPILEHS